MKKMTKNMKKNLTWKLNELPNAGELADLVDSGVISKEEARDIMFGNAESDKDKIEALEKLVEFLQGLVKDLTKNKQTFVPFERTIYVDRSIRPYFDRYWMSTSKKLGSQGWTLTANNAGTMSTSTSAFYANTGSSPVAMTSSNAQDAIKLSVSMDSSVS
jgi:hypothetical protein